MYIGSTSYGIPGTTYMNYRAQTVKDSEVYLC